MRLTRAALICALVTLGALVQAVPAMAGPVNGSPPELGGTGRTLSTSNGSWLPDDNSYTYGWARCDAAGANCAGVPGQAGRSYLLTTPDVGKTIRSVVTATNAVLGPTSAPSAPTAIIVAAPPRNVVPPAVTRSGSVLTSTLGTWTDPSPGSVAYERRWQRCAATGDLICQDVPGAVGATYTLTSADVGTFIRVVVSAEGLGKSFAQSTPEGGLRKLRPFPRIIVAGRRVGGLTLISELAVRRGPTGATVSVRCRGRGCPRGGFRKKLGRSGSMRLTRFQRTYRPGTIIEIRITKAGAIGKFTRLKVRGRSIPSRRDECLIPGTSNPRGCP